MQIFKLVVYYICEKKNERNFITLKKYKAKEKQNVKEWKCKKECKKS